jgi:hypothetical protein
VIYLRIRVEYLQTEGRERERKTRITNEKRMMMMMVMMMTTIEKAIAEYLP